MMGKACKSCGSVLNSVDKTKMTSAFRIQGSIFLRCVNKRCDDYNRDQYGKITGYKEYIRGDGWVNVR